MVSTLRSEAQKSLDSESATGMIRIHINAKWGLNKENAITVQVQ